ncbi:conjugal transfer protein TraD [Streptobacillus felis]|uniref:conjugal transfer protein TraD n=1 Tax=Streptobacillus felis TaxID=1384509 RepID=UPI0008340501|nr:conjugal transfer protein TraD [Streptobacillus felis]
MKKLENMIVQLIKEQRKEKNIKNNKEKLSRKERAHKLIQLGTLFMILEVDEEDHDLLIGLLMNYYNLSDEEKEKLRQKGEAFRIERAKMLEEEKEKNG